MDAGFMMKSDDIQVTGMTETQGHVTLEQALQALSYPVEKKQLRLPGIVTIQIGDKLIMEEGPLVDAWALVRTDKSPNIVLYPAVGADYTIVQNKEFLDRLKETVLAPEIGYTFIESCGTLFAGQKAFVNIHVNRMKIEGDDAEYTNKLIYINFFGGGALWAALAATRAVSNTTLRLVRAQGAANQTLRNFRHTKGVSNRVSSYVAELTGIQEEIAEYKTEMIRLSGVRIDDEEAGKILKKVFPTSQADDGTDSVRSDVLAQTHRNACLQYFQAGDTALTADLRPTLYGLFLAVCYYVDHDMKIRGGSDAAGRWYSGVGGSFDKLKQRAFEVISVA